MKSLRENISKIHGQQGQDWLEHLPEMILEIARKYNLEGLSVYDHLSFNYVATGYQHGQAIILKMGPNSTALLNEAACLNAFVGKGAAVVLAADENMIITECAVPGITLKDCFPEYDFAATTVFCEYANKLHTAKIPAEHDFHHVRHLLKILDQDLAIPRQVLSNAKTLADALLRSTVKEVLLHGDLHHDNILQNAQEWIVIDPKGFVGDCAFEPAAYLCNPIPELLQQKNVKQIINRRVKLCAEKLGLPQKRILDWLYVKSVLRWAWSLEDNLDPGYHSDTVDLLSHL